MLFVKLTLLAPVGQHRPVRYHSLLFQELLDVVGYCLAKPVHVLAQLIGIVGRTLFGQPCTTLTTHRLA